MKVLFLPQNTVPVKVCNHRWGAKASVSQCTDTFSNPSATAAEYIGFKHNIAPTFFLSCRTPNIVADVVNSMRCGWGLYLTTSYWYREGEGSVSMPPIPDYTSTVWTAAGAAVFANAVVGQPKPNQYPKHGQEMYDVSNGAFGYDFVNNMMGASNLSELLNMVDAQKLNYKSDTGLTCSTLSYQNGVYGFSPFIIDRFLVGRNSDATGNTDGDGRTAYGIDKYNSDYLGYPDIPFTKIDRISQASTTRFMNNGNKDLAFIADQITKTIANGGWFNDFIHYHSEFNEFDDVEAFYQTMNETIGDDFVWRCGYNEAAEYMFLREGIRESVGIERDGKVLCYLHVTDFLSGNFDKINTNISVEVDLTGTSLSGKFIKSNAGQIKSNGNNKYIIDLKLVNLKEAVYSFYLEEAESGSHYANFNLPSATTSVSGDILTVSTDLPTRAVLFNINDAASYNITAGQRKNTLSKTHTFNLAGLESVKVGLITERLQSVIIDQELLLRKTKSIQL